MDVTAVFTNLLMLSARLVDTGRCLDGSISKSCSVSSVMVVPGLVFSSVLK